MENESRKLDSQLWNSEKVLESSEWIAENVKGLDQSVKEILLLIEHDGDFSSEKPRSGHPELIACIKEISHKHHLLVDHYKKLTGEFKNYEKTTFGTQLTHPFLTPDKKMGQVAPSEFSLSSGGGISDTTPVEGSESSLLSTDSDSESCNSSSPSEKMRISDYEKELRVSKEKLEFAEEEIARLKSQLQNSESLVAKIGSIEARLVSAQNQIDLHEAEREEENKRSLMLQRQIVGLEAELEKEKWKVGELHERIKYYVGELSDRDLEIQQLKGEIEDSSANFALEKWQLESSVLKLSETVNELQKQCEFFEAEKVDMVREQEALNVSWEADIEHVKIELHEKNLIIATLNEKLEKLKLNYDMLMAEKDGVDDRTLCLENKVCCLNKVIAELKSRIDELEEEVGTQAVMISDAAEEKREVIRQLCFSLDHFRSAYQELRAISKRRTAMVL